MPGALEAIAAGPEPRAESIKACRPPQDRKAVFFNQPLVVDLAKLKRRDVFLEAASQFAGSLSRRELTFGRT